MRASQIETEFPLRCVVTERTDTLATRLADATARRRLKNLNDLTSSDRVVSIRSEDNGPVCKISHRLLWPQPNKPRRTANEVFFAESRS